MGEGKCWLGLKLSERRGIKSNSFPPPSERSLDAMAWDVSHAPEELVLENNREKWGENRGLSINQSINLSISPSRLIDYE